jgi:septal ring-binding cell division protein DamX
LNDRIIAIIAALATPVAKSKDRPSKKTARSISLSGMMTQ